MKFFGGKTFIYLSLIISLLFIAVSAFNKFNKEYFSKTYTITPDCYCTGKRINNIRNCKHYNPDYVRFLNIFKNKNLVLSNGWKQVDINNDKKPDFFFNPDSGFEATAFKKDKKVVIVIRGMGLDWKDFKNGKSVSAFIGKDGQNAREIFLGNFGIPMIGSTPKQFDDAVDFYEIIRKKNPDSKIILVGKSLGGALATLLGAVKGLDTYTFAAPGVAYALSRLDRKYSNELRSNMVNGFSYIKNYRNINDPVAAYGEHIGESFVYPPVHPKESFLDTHVKVEHFEHVQCFKKFVESPKEWKYEYTVALVYYDKDCHYDKKQENFKKALKISYGVDKNDFKKATELLEKYFKNT